MNCNPDLLARACNRIKQADKGDATQGSDILRRRWLLIDADPVRPAGISSTDQEHESALERIHIIVAHLRAAGWPGALVADSGNGAHALYRIDLPADDGGMVQRILQALAARFDDAAVSVDTSVHNPARIWKLYGTMACKGDDVADRPWRMARIIEAPDELELVPIELMQSVAAEIPTGPSPRRTHVDGAPFDIDAFIQRHQLEIDGPEAWSGQQGPGRRWVLRRSLLCEHHEGAAYILEHASRAVSAGCQHNSCSWTWQDLRRRLDSPSEHSAHTKEMVSMIQTPSDGSQPWPDPERLDERTLPDFPLHVLPATLRDWVVAESHATQTPADLAGLLALAVCSSCIAGHVEIEPHDGWRELVNLFVAILLAPGNRKSAVFADATRPLREVERHLTRLLQ